MPEQPTAPGRKPRKGQTKFGENRMAWIDLKFQEMVVYMGPPAVVEDGPATPGDDVMIHMRRTGSARFYKIDFSDMTEAEVKGIRELFTYAFDRAEENARLRDEHATREWEEHGNDAYARLYRAVPQVHIRQRGKPEHGEGVQGRSGWASRRNTGSKRAPVSDDGLPGPEPEDVESSNDPSEGVDNPIVGEVGG